MTGDNKKGDGDKKNAHVEYLLMTLDSEQWKSLSHIRCIAYPVTLEDKRRLLSEMKS